MNCLKEEIRNILYNKTMIVFMVICIIFNIGLIIATSSKSGEWKKMSENYEYQSGQEIFKDIDGSELGLAYYDERYQKSNTLVAWMHEKYQKLESSLEMLSEQQADLSTYAGELTPYVHMVLFEYLTKALMIEGMLLFAFLVLETFFMEYHNKTAYIVYSSFRGRRTAFDKKKAEARAHILEGLRIALDHIDEIISIIRKSYNDAKDKLIERFSFFCRNLH